MFCGRAFWIVLIVVALAGGGGHVAYANNLVPWFGPEEPVVEDTTLETAAATTDNLSITADGVLLNSSGQIVSPASTCIWKEDILPGENTRFDLGAQYEPFATYRLYAQAERDWD